MSIFLQLNQQFHKLIASAYEETENMKNVVSDMVKKNLQNIGT
jgi:flagellar biosynthesis/type III secretory pathway protein FliH